MNTSTCRRAPAIVATDIQRTYGSVQAVAGVDLEVERGEIIAILGPNGAGKTTLVEILEGLRRRTAGTVSVLGQDPQHGDSAWRARIGAVLQLGTETDELTVSETLHAHASYYPAPRAAADIVHALDLTGLEGRRVRLLSGGQRRRLDIALGIVGKPELLFLDEPTTGLDAEVRRSIWRLIQSLVDNGTTVVMTTHYLDEVEYLAERTMVMVDGAIVWSGKTSNLRNTSARSSVTFELRAPFTVSDLPASLAEASTQAGDRLAIETDDSTRVVSELMQWASSIDDPNPVGNLQVGRPSLEDSYLALLGTTYTPTEVGS
ncbi:MAG: ABC transporter ATP-binding protein [Actinomycetia bacterium]|nr:ABC transporter ATP-binding protein [Actinomycetes bacterium]